MSPRKQPKKPKTIPERIVEFFDFHTEGHISAICSYARIDEDTFRAWIGQARDLKVEPGFRLTPVYRRAGAVKPGWWTVRPTEHIVAWSDHAELDRNLGAWNRNARVQQGMKFDDQLASIRRSLKFQIADLMEQHFAELGISADSDYVIVAINDAISEDKTSVLR